MTKAERLHQLLVFFWTLAVLVVGSISPLYGGQGKSPSLPPDEEARRHEAAKKLADHGISTFSATPLVATESPLDYPNRAVGLLTMFIDDDSKSDGDCSAFLIGPNLIATSAHCYFTSKGAAQELYFTITQTVASTFGRRRTHEVKMNPVASGWLGYEESTNPYDWIYLELESEYDPMGKKLDHLGNQLGYFGTHTGYDSKSPGFKGKVLSSQTTFPDGDCQAGHVPDYYKTDFATDPLNYTISELNTVSTHTKWFNPLEAPVCSAGYPGYNPKTRAVNDFMNSPLYISNCGIGAIKQNIVITDCSIVSGMSGGPVYYYDKVSDAYIAIAINKSSFPKDRPDYLRLSFGRDHYNIASFIGVDNIPNYFDWRVNKTVTASNQFPDAYRPDAESVSPKAELISTFSSEVIEVAGFEGIDVRISRTGNAGTVVLKQRDRVVFRYAPSGSAVLWDVERLELDEYENPVLVVVWLTGVRALELVVFDPAKLPEPIVLKVHSADVLERQVEGGRLRIELTETKEDEEGDWEEVPSEVVWPPVPPRIEEGGE